jgi:hypothetical protein
MGGQETTIGSNANDACEDVGLVFGVAIFVTVFLVVLCED